MSAHVRLYFLVYMPSEVLDVGLEPHRAPLRATFAFSLAVGSFNRAGGRCEHYCFFIIRYATV